jgi:AraC-like DNA-binding protein
VDLPIPEPGPDDVLVRGRTAGVGPWDAKTREGLFGTRSRTVGAWREPMEDRRKTRDRRRWVRWGKALEVIHQQPDHPWTVAELAARVSMSRTGFAVRFTTIAGIAPLDYVRKWRMQKASDFLRQGEEPLEDIAGRVGYESGAAFSKAFKREMGLPPGRYRKEQVSSVTQVLRS